MEDDGSYSANIRSSNNRKRDQLNKKNNKIISNKIQATLQPNNIKQNIEKTMMEEFMDFDDDPNAILPFKDRCYLCERIKLLTNDGLSSLVRFIEKQLPKAVDYSDLMNLKINLSMLDQKIFDQLNQLIDTYLKVRETNQENLILKKSGLK